MIRHLLLVLACSGCFLDEATLAPQHDAGEPPTMDSGNGSDSGDPLPPGVSQLAAGHYLGFASHVANGKIYGVEYSSTALIAHSTRIVSIDTTTGAVETFYDLAANPQISPTNLQASDTALFWLRQTGTTTALYRKPLTAAASTEPVLVAGVSNLPADYTLDMYALYPGDNKIYVMLTKGASYTLGTVPIGSIATTAAPFTSLVSGTIPNASSISFVSITNTIAHLGTIVYAGGHVSGGTSSGFVLKIDTNAKTGVVVSSLANTFMQSFWATGVRVQWLADTAGAVTMFVGDPLNYSNTGAVASLPNGTYSLVAMGSGFYITSLPGTGTDMLRVTPGTTPAVPPTGTTSMVASITDCVGQNAQDCVSKISLLATDAMSVYWSAADAIYKYTP